MFFCCWDGGGGISQDSSVILFISVRGKIELKEHFKNQKSPVFVFTCSSQLCNPETNVWKRLGCLGAGGGHTTYSRSCSIGWSASEPWISLPSAIETAVSIGSGASSVDSVCSSVVQTFGLLVDGLTFDLGSSAACSAGSSGTDPVEGSLFGGVRYGRCGWLTQKTTRR